MIRRKRDHALLGIAGNTCKKWYFCWFWQNGFDLNIFKWENLLRSSIGSPKPETSEPPLISPSLYSCICDQVLSLFSLFLTFIAHDIVLFQAYYQDYWSSHLPGPFSYPFSTGHPNYSDNSGLYSVLCILHKPHIKMLNFHILYMLKLKRVD